MTDDDVITNAADFMSTKSLVDRLCARRDRLRAGLREALDIADHLGLVIDGSKLRRLNDRIAELRKMAEEA